MLGTSTFGLAMKLHKWFPVRIVDKILLVLSKIVIGSTEKFGIKRPKIGPMELKNVSGKSPVLDIGAVSLIKKGKIKVRSLSCMLYYLHVSKLLFCFCRDWSLDRLVYFCFTLVFIEDFNSSLLDLLKGCFILLLQLFKNINIGITLNFGLETRSIVFQIYQYIKKIHKFFLFTFVFFFNFLC